MSDQRKVYESWMMPESGEIPTVHSARMLQRANAFLKNNNTSNTATLLVRFALIEERIAVEAERERCARVAETCGMPCTDHVIEQDLMRHNIAAAIRATPKEE